MKSSEAVILFLILFIVAGVLSYVVETIIFRNTGRIGRYEDLWAYYKKIDQKNGNIAVIVWAGLWVLIMALGALLFYLLS